MNSKKHGNIISKKTLNGIVKLILLLNDWWAGLKVNKENRKRIAPK